MKCTVEWMKKRYDYWNKKAFDGTLPCSDEIVFRTYDSFDAVGGHQFLGAFSWVTNAIMAWLRYEHGPSIVYNMFIDEWKANPNKLTYMEIKLFNKYDGPQKFFDQSLLHEMCHIKDMMQNGDGGQILFDTKEDRFIKNPDWNCSRDTHSETFNSIAWDVYEKTGIAPGAVMHNKDGKKVADWDWTIMRGNGRYLYNDLFEFYKAFKMPKVGDY